MPTTLLKNVSRLLTLDLATWSRFYTSWFDSLVQKLGARYGQVEREDAVTQAFLKLMYEKPVSSYNHFPASDSEWFGCLYWQAKAALSHYYEHEVLWEGHHKKAYAQGYVMAQQSPFCTIDKKVSQKALYATLESLCKEVGMKPENMNAYIRHYLNGEPTEKVAAEAGITCNNLHQIRNRVEKLLANRGAQRYKEIRRRLFLEAA